MLSDRLDAALALHARDVGRLLGQHRGGSVGAEDLAPTTACARVALSAADKGRDAVASRPLSVRACSAAVGLQVAGGGELVELGEHVVELGVGELEPADHGAQVALPVGELRGASLYETHQP